MLTIVAADDCSTIVAVDPATRALVSWNTRAPSDTLELVVTRLDGHRSHALPYVTFERPRRASLNTFDAVARLETDIVGADVPIATIAVHTHHPLDRIAVSTPVHAPPGGGATVVRRPCELNVPARSQYDPRHPDERGWCAPASIAMLLAANGTERTVDEVAAGVYDATYKGTGNWTFCVAYAGALGLLGAAMYLRDLAQVEAFLAARMPLAVSIAWAADALPGAPLEASAGHVLVVRGIDAAGDVIVNDPAQPDVRHVYPRAAFERCWLAHGGVALVIAPADRTASVIACANG